MVVALLYCLFRRKIIPFLKQRKTLEGKEHKSFEYDKISLKYFDFKELERATKNFSQDYLPGSGAFGNVYKGTFDLDGTLAIKRAHSESFSSVEEFRNEVRLLSAVDVLNLNDIHCIAYLHEGVKPSIIHRDIKPSNILLGESFEAKVSDFGLVRLGPIGDQSHVSSQIKGTPGYLDPAYFSSFHLNKFSDIYSFGIIPLQLVSARPVVDCTENQNQHIIDWARPSLEKGRVEEIMDANLLCQSEPCNMKAMLKMGQLALRCVVVEPKHRPTMTQGFLRPIDSSQQSTKSETRGSLESYDCSQSFVSIDGVGFQKFHVDMDSFSFKSTDLRSPLASKLKGQSSKWAS
ncbi:hypothetical protein VNO78_35021 [Psophocarpus tetragonolobus]|uniref:Protein kinase domain-containing protein n=1 Tax=Psophocarpus tetragonolobus TaxID=3891 RepID=A0AAN9NNT9_PSOTE